MWCDWVTISGRRKQQRAWLLVITPVAWQTQLWQVLLSCLSTVKQQWVHLCVAWGSAGHGDSSWAVLGREAGHRGAAVCRWHRAVPGEGCRAAPLAARPRQAAGQLVMVGHCRGFASVRNTCCQTCLAEIKTGHLSYSLCFAPCAALNCRVSAGCALGAEVGQWERQALFPGGGALPAAWPRNPEGELLATRALTLHEMNEVTLWESA